MVKCYGHLFVLRRRGVDDLYIGFGAFRNLVQRSMMCMDLVRDWILVWGLFQSLVLRLGLNDVVRGRRLDRERYVVLYRAINRDLWD